MSSHSFHPDIYEAGLEESCPRCREHAEHPDGLDAQNRARLLRGEIHSRLDQVAAGRLRALEFERLLQKAREAR